MKRQIPVTDLRVGMTVYRESGDKLVKDCTLKTYFQTSSKFPTISFVTDANQKVIWRACGKVWVE